MRHKKKALLPLMFGAIGVVFGDIGTSPLYAVKSCFSGTALSVTPSNILGIISLILWVLIFVVTVKYVLCVMRVDHNGEGGVLALSSLCKSLFTLSQTTTFFTILGILGISLFLGDGVITPAISVLSAVEGIAVLSPSFATYTLPISFIVLSFLFYIQHRGSGLIGRFFGPIMMLWFLSLALMGGYHILKNPLILMSLNPYYGINFLYSHGTAAFLTLGGVILIVTGAEALYADLGHFSKKSIALSWHTIVFPCLTLNYLGQGALLLDHPEALSHTFYQMVSPALTLPLIFLSTIATVVASQSIISGIFSVGWQAILLNYLPRMRVVHTSSHQKGQVYIPAINAILYGLTTLAILKFQTSDNLAHAYGASVACIMALTSILYGFVVYRTSKRPFIKLLLLLPFLLLDGLFVMTNSLKFLDGAWYAFAITAVVFYIIHIWRKGSQKLMDHEEQIYGQDLKKYIKNYELKQNLKLPATAIFLTRYVNRVPQALRIHLRHNIYLHEKMFFFNVCINDRPIVHGSEKFTLKRVHKKAFYVIGQFGFREIPDLGKMIKWLKDQKLIQSDEKLSFFLSRSVPIISRSKALSGFSEKLFIFLARNAESASSFYKIPYDDVVDIRVRCPV